MDRKIIHTKVYFLWRGNCRGNPHSALIFIKWVRKVRWNTYSRGKKEKEKVSYSEVSQEATESLITWLKQKRWSSTWSLNLTDQRCREGCTLSKITEFRSFHNSQAAIRNTSIKKSWGKCISKLKKTKKHTSTGHAMMYLVTKLRFQVYQVWFEQKWQEFRWT